jgi:hypothetical protein
MLAFLWESRDGTLTPVWKMTDTHLINTINFIKKKEVGFPMIFHRMQEEAFKRGLLKAYEIEEIEEDFTIHMKGISFLDEDYDPYEWGDND